MSVLFTLLEICDGCNLYSTVDSWCGRSCSAAINPFRTPCPTTECPCGNLYSTTVGNDGNLWSTIKLLRGNSCPATYREVVSPCSATECPCGNFCSITMGANGNLGLSSAFSCKTPCLPHCRRAEIPVRPRSPCEGATEPPRRFPRWEARHICYLRSNNKTSSAEWTIARSVQPCVMDLRSTTETLRQSRGETKR